MGLASTVASNANPPLSYEQREEGLQQIYSKLGMKDPYATTTSSSASSSSATPVAAAAPAKAAAPAAGGGKTLLGIPVGGAAAQPADQAEASSSPFGKTLLGA